MAIRGTDPESYVTEYTLVYEKNSSQGCKKLLPSKQGTTQINSTIPALRMAQIQAIIWL